MAMRNLMILTLLLVGSLVQLKAELIINFLPTNDYYFTRNQIWNFTVLNNGKVPISASIEVKILKNGSFPVMTSEVQTIELQRGLTSLSESYPALAMNVFGSGYESERLQSTGFLPPGDYAICVSIKNSVNQVIGYSCKELHVNSFTLPVLSSPMNNAVLYSVTPLLTWLPVLPVGVYDISYKIELWETGLGAYKKTRNLLEAETSLNSYQYHAGLPPLVAGENYSWKVSAYSNEFYLGCTEIWQFTVTNPTVAKMAELDEDSYRTIGAETENALYLVEDILRVRYLNTANDSILEYSIVEENDPEVFVVDLPSVVLSRGDNKLEIDLSDVEGIVVGTTYLLQIIDANYRKYYLRFGYTE